MSTKNERKSAPEKRRRGRPTERRIKLDASPIEVARSIFAAAKQPDPSKRVAARTK